MKTTPENEQKKALAKLLKELNIFSYPNSAGPYSVAGVSDRTAIHNGQYIALEVKKPGGKATPLQIKFLQDVEDAGGKSFLIDGPESLKDLKLWLSQR